MSSNHPGCRCISPTHSFCHVTFMHHILALHWLCSFSVASGCSLSVEVVSTMRSMSPMKNYTISRSTREAKTPCSFRYNPTLAPALFSCIRTTTFQLLHAAVVEPLSPAWPVIATVNRWNPLAWVGVVWALMCLLIHACCHACYCLELR